MKTRQTLSAVAALALGLGALTACGSTSDAKEGAPPSPLRTVSKAQFVQEGNALCRSNGAKIAAGFKAMSEPPKPAELQAAYDTMLRESYKVTGDLLAIGAPKGQEKQLVDLLVQMQHVTERAEAQGADKYYADTSDPWAGAVHTLVNDFGLTDCKHDG